MYITEENYNGILTLSTIINGYRIKQRYIYHSKKDAYKQFRQYIRQIKNGGTL